MRVSGFVLGAAATLLTVSAAQADMTFLDHRGKTITLKEPPKRIVSMFASGPLVHTAVEGTDEHFVGVNVKAKKTYENGIYAELLPDLLKLNFDVAGEGFAPNVEAILALKPDAVLQWTFDPKIIEPLERVNLQVIGWDCCTKEQRRDYLRLAGYTTNRIDRAQTILNMQDKSENGLKEIFAKAKLEKPTSLLVIDQVKESVQVIANSSQDYSLSGTANLATDNSGEWWRTIDAEQLLVWNPDIIVIPAYAADLKPADIYGNPMFASIAAVKNKRVYKFPQFDRSPDAAEIFLNDDWLARVAHPELFNGAKPFSATMTDSYQVIYQKDLTDAQIKSILELDQNKDSAGYNDILG
jgi:iron complex transport system substrate-binding protein